MKKLDIEIKSRTGISVFATLAWMISRCNYFRESEEGCCEEELFYA